MSLIFLLVFLGQLAQAVDLSTSGIYRATNDACTKVKAEDLTSLKFDKLRAGYFPSVEFTGLMNLIRSSSARRTALEFRTEPDDYATYLLKHPEFLRALMECYPNEPRMIEFFKQSVSNSDRAGKFVGIAAIVAVFRGQTQLFQLINRWYAGVYKILKLGQNVALGTIVLSLLKSDSEQKEKEVTFDDLIRNAEKKAGPAPDSKLDQLNSLRAQIAIEEQKILSCGQCSEAEMLKRQTAALHTLLKAYNRN